MTHDEAQDIIRRIDWAIEEMENVKKVVRMYEEEKKEKVSNPPWVVTTGSTGVCTRCGATLTNSPHVCN